MRRTLSIRKKSRLRFRRSKNWSLRLRSGCSGLYPLRKRIFVRKTRRTDVTMPLYRFDFRHEIAALCHTCWNDVATYKMYITAAWKCTKQMITLVTTPNSLAYFRILSGPDWKENCAVSAKSSMGTRLRLHNTWEHCTCTPKRRQRKREKETCLHSDAFRATGPFFFSMFNSLSHQRRRFANNWVIAI